ncbi:MAG: Fic family protein [Acidobacteria bacterium]|nr:MAG: Fic family protein [Acidobacteriota bacterium]
MSSPSRLPPKGDLETTEVLRACNGANRHLAELKGRAATIPNEGILIDTLPLQEARDSLAIENIVTTQDDLFQAELFQDSTISPAAKEIRRYARALDEAFVQVRETRLIRSKDIQRINAILTGNDAGFRRTPGTTLKDSGGRIVYTPPQHPDEIIDLMGNLVTFINDDSMCNWDPLVKMAVIHHQFESIHPFYDGNGRTGRLLNILYLVAKQHLEIPVLYLSRAIIQTKNDYYRLLQSVRDDGNWQPWLIYILQAVEETSQSTLRTVESIQTLMLATKHRMRNELGKVYSQDLINNIFRHPYTKIAFVQSELGVSRPTATRYAELLVQHDFLEKQRFGRSNYYINSPLVRLLVAAGGGE